MNSSLTPLIGSKTVEKTVIPTLTTPTIVSIQPPVTIVEPGESFQVDVYIEPGEPIIAANIDCLHFNPNLIHANYVTYNGFFAPYETYNNSEYQIIDNVNGEIKDIVELIIGVNGVTTPGSWVTIEFTAQQQLGTSYLNLSGVIVSDVNGSAVPIEVYDGSVTVVEDATPPEITNVVLTTSDPLDQCPPWGWENFTCIVTDDIGVDTVQLNLTYPDAHTEYITMIKDGDHYYYHTTLTMACYYNYHIYATDTSGNHNVSDSEEFFLPFNEDINMDGCVNFWDLIRISLSFSGWGPNGWCREDVNNDGKVHFMDLVAVSLAYNSCCY